MTSGNVIKLVNPITSLTASSDFLADVEKNCKGQGLASFDGSYEWQIFDENNPKGGLGTFTIKASVAVSCCSKDDWDALGVATIYDEWDFINWEWGKLISKVWDNISLGRPITYGREPRTFAGSFISGEEFKITSDESGVSESAGDNYLRWF